MCMGIGGSARAIMQDADTIIYEYCVYNWNDEKCKNPDYVYDGIITIDKHSLVEPEIHEKLKKQPSGRKKLITKRIPRDVDYAARIAAGQIRVENSSFCWQLLDNGIDYMAMRIIYNIFDLYQTEGTIPEKVRFHV